MNDYLPILPSLTAIIVAFALYHLFHRHQLQVARHTLVRQLEEDAAALLRGKSAHRVEKEVKLDLEFRVVLDRSDWDPELYRITDDLESGQRYVIIRQTTGTKFLVSTQALQETLTWFRRIKRALDDGILKENDLLDLWRTTLPFEIGNRKQYFRRVFGEHDFSVLDEILQRTRKAVEKKGHQTAREFLQPKEEQMSAPASPSAAAEEPAIPKVRAESVEAEPAIESEQPKDPEEPEKPEDPPAGAGR